MRRWPASSFQRYFYAVLAVVIILLARLTIADTINDRSPLMVFLLGVIIVSLHGGFGPGVLVTFLSLLAADWTFIAPNGALIPEHPLDSIRLVVFAAEGIAVAWVGSRLKTKRTELIASLDSTRQALDRERRAERDAREAREARVASENRFRSLVESLPLIVWQGRVDGQVDYVNQHWVRFTGRSFASSLGDAWTKALHPDDAEWAVKTWRAAIRSGEPFTAEVRFRRHDGAYRWHLIHACLIKDADGKTDIWLGTCQDIHDRKEAEADWLRAKMAAEEASRAKSAFLANMSHEIRTPMNAVIGFTELLKDPEVTPEEFQEYIQAIERNGHSLLRLIDDILDLSKVEAERIDIEAIEFELLAFIAAVDETLQIKARERGIALAFHVSPAVPHIVVSDPDRLKQVLFNIVGNAIKFTAQGSVTVTVTHTQLDPGRCRVFFHVEDTGAGLSLEQQAKLFQPFVQADSSTTRLFGGTGLGLALSRRLARLLGGDVELLSSERGRGSVFSVSIEAGIARSPEPNGWPATSHGIKIADLDWRDNQEGYQ